MESQEESDQLPEEAPPEQVHEDRPDQRQSGYREGGRGDQDEPSKGRPGAPADDPPATGNPNEDG